jgi:methyltransferase
VTLALLALVFVPMIVEARRAARNEKLQRRLGGIEPTDDVYQLMKVAYPSAFLVMILEGTISSRHSSTTATAGLALFACAKALKWWAIVSLGTRWTFRVIVVPGAALVTSGPYRYMRHPNYLAVLGELIAVALTSGAAIAGPTVTAAFAALIVKRIAVENRALGAILRRT